MSANRKQSFMNIQAGRAKRLLADRLGQVSDELSLPVKRVNRYAGLQPAFEEHSLTSTSSNGEQ